MKRILTQHMQSEKVLQTWEKYTVTQKCKNILKNNRLLKRAKHNVNNLLKNKRLGKSVVHLLKHRKKIIADHIENEYITRNNNQVEKVVDVQRAGGVDSATFWTVKRKILGGHQQTAHAIMDESGEIQEEEEEEEEEEIKKVYKEYFTKLLN